MEVEIWVGWLVFPGAGTSASKVAHRVLGPQCADESGNAKGPIWSRSRELGREELGKITLVLYFISVVFHLYSHLKPY